MELYLKLIDVLFPVFFIIGIGYYLGKKIQILILIYNKFCWKYSVLQLMIFYTITQQVTLGIFIEYFIYALIIIGGFALVGLYFFLFLKRDNEVNYSFNLS